jgi:hypothetical protein
MDRTQELKELIAANDAKMHELNNQNKVYKQELAELLAPFEPGQIVEGSGYVKGRHMVVRVVMRYSEPYLIFRTLKKDGTPGVREREWSASSFKVVD